MKKKTGLFLRFIGNLMILIMIVSTSFFTSRVWAEKNNAVDIIKKFAEAIEKRDVKGYIGLFTSDIEKEMIEYIESEGTDNFFIEAKREILEVNEVSPADYLKEKYGEILVYRVAENIVLNRESKESFTLKEGVGFSDFIFVKEGANWKIKGISTIDNTRSSNGSCPELTTIYMSKQANYDYYHVRTKVLIFEEYLKNVLPCEWTISYFNQYPAYGRAGTMASKMYAWYYTVNPKWNFAPYYACMKDTTADQQFLYSAYSDMPVIYRGYEDTVLTFIRNKALVRATDNSLFEIHYHQYNGTYHSGQLNESGALQMAQNGSGYADILHYYYDQSSYIGYSVNCRIRILLGN